MKRFLIAATLLISHVALAAPDSQCIAQVEHRVKEAVNLFPAVDPATVQVSFVRAAPGRIQAMDEEPAENGFRIYTKVHYKEKKGALGFWLNESGVISAESGGAGCQVLYSKVDVAS